MNKKTSLGFIFLTFFPLCMNSIDFITSDQKKPFSWSAVIKNTAGHKSVYLPVVIPACTGGLVLYCLIDSPKVMGLSVFAFGTIAVAQLADGKGYVDPMRVGIALGVPAALYAGNFIYKLSKEYRAERKRCAYQNKKPSDL